MAWSDASQRLEEMPDARSGCDSSIPNSSSISTPTAAACRCRYQSLTAGGMIKTTSDLIIVRPHSGNHYVWLREGARRPAWWHQPELRAPFFWGGGPVGARGQWAPWKLIIR